MSLESLVPLSKDDPDVDEPSRPDPTIKDITMNEFSLRRSLIETIWFGKDPWTARPPAMMPDLQGWGSDHPYLGEAVSSSGPQCVAVEVGVWKGGSAISMGRRMKELGISGIVIAVDTWLGSWDHWIQERWFNELKAEGGLGHLYDVFRTNVIEQGVEDYVLPLPLDSINAAYVLRHYGIAPNVVHIDGGHDFSAVLSDLQIWWPLLADGGTLIGDDYYVSGEWPDVKRGFDSFFGGASLKNIDGKCIIIKQGNSIYPSLPNTSDQKELQVLREENSLLKKLLAESMLDIAKLRA
jgi:hypothetical protein